MFHVYPRINGRRFLHRPCSHCKDRPVKAPDQRYCRQCHRESMRLHREKKQCNRQAR